MKRLKRYLASLCKYVYMIWFGGATYLSIEVFYRGYTHAAMFMVGVLAFVLVGGVNRYLPWEMRFWVQCIIGGAIITAIELIFGVYLNMYMKLHIWDYSGKPFNLYGQICMEYSVKWVVLAGVAILLYDVIDHKFFGGEQPRYRVI